MCISEITHVNTKIVRHMNTIFTAFTLDFPIHIDAIDIGLYIVYVKGLPVKISYGDVTLS